MKYELLFAVLATLCGAFASPLAEVPETRASLSCLNNLTITTVNSVLAHQSTSYWAMTGAFFTLNLNYFSPSIFAQYNWFLFNYLTVGTQLTVINTALTASFGASLFTGGACGKKSVSDAMVVIVSALQQANEYYSGMDSAGSSAMATKIQAIITLQGQINSAMSCANTYQYMSFSCPDSLITKIAQFSFQASFVMMSITTGWCGKCSSDPSKCAVAPTTVVAETTTPASTESTSSTTEATTTTTTAPDLLSFMECLANLGTLTVEATLALTASFWELNISLFSVAISGPYYFFVQNLGMAYAEGSVMMGAMLLYGSFGVTAIEGAFGSLISIIMQSNEYIMMIDAAAYAEISIEIQLLCSMQLEIVGELNHCKHDFSPLWHSCGYGPYKKFANFILMFIQLFVRIILIWCNICSAMPDFCENPMSSTMSGVTGGDMASTTAAVGV